MIAVLTTAVALLATIMAINLLLSLGLIRRIRRGELFGTESAVIGLPKPGLRVARFEARSIDGELITDDSISDGPQLVAFVAPLCEPCERLKRSLAKDPPEERVVLLVQALPDADATHAFVDALRPLGAVAVTNSGDGTLEAFGVQGFPTLIRLDDGVVSAAGRTLREVVESRPIAVT